MSHLITLYPGGSSQRHKTSRRTHRRNLYNFVLRHRNYLKRKTNTLDFNKIKLFLVKLPLGKNKRQGINWRKPNVVPISKNGLYPEYIENFYNSLVRRKTTHF